MEIVILSFVCAAVCVWAIIWKKVKMSKCTQEVTAVYLGAAGYSGKYKSPIVTISFIFNYSYMGKDIQMAQSINSKSTITFNREKYMEKLGYKREQEYKIYINPDKPEQFKTLDGDNNLVLWFGTIFMAALGMLALK